MRTTAQPISVGSTLRIEFLSLGDSKRYQKKKKRTSKKRIVLNASKKKWLLKNTRKSEEKRDILFTAQYPVFIVLNICCVSHTIMRGAKNNFTIHARRAVFSFWLVLDLQRIIFHIYSMTSRAFELPVWYI